MKVDELFNKLYKGCRVYDNKMEMYGIVKDCTNPHNIFIEYIGGGSGVYCLVINCEDEQYDDSLKFHG